MGREADGWPVDARGEPVQFGQPASQRPFRYEPDKVAKDNRRASFYCPDHGQSLARRQLAVVTLDGFLMTRLDQWEYPSHTYDVDAPCWDDTCPGWRIDARLLREAMRVHAERGAQGTRGGRELQRGMDSVGTRRVAVEDLSPRL